MTSIFAACLLGFNAIVVTLASAGPVNVRIETENNQDFPIGPEPRTRFDLVEEYRPLARAINTKHARAFASSLSKPRQAIRRPQPVHLLVDIGEMSKDGTGGGGGQGRDAGAVGTALKQNGGDGMKMAQQQQQQQQAQGGGISPLSSPNIGKRQQQMITKSQWLDWTRWSRCENGERIRVRKCLSINGMPCEGPSIEKQNCFSAISSGIKFAKDPIIIEREIRGEILSSQRRLAAAKN